MVVEANEKTKDEGEGSLEWAIVGKGGGGTDEKVKEKTGCQETDDNAGNNSVDEEEIVGQGIAEEEESRLEHER